MFENKEDKRRFKRIVFPGEQSLTCIVCFPDNPNKKLEINIINLSEGGIGISMPRSGGGNIFKGDILILQGFKGSFPILLENKIDIEIRWIMDHPFLKEVMAGCQFINMPQGVRDKIKDIVDSE